MVIFVTSSSQFSMKFRDNSKNKNRRIFVIIFPTLFSTFHIFHEVFKVWPLLRGGGGGLHILNSNRAKILSKRFRWFWEFFFLNVQNFWIKISAFFFQIFLFMSGGSAPPPPHPLPGLRPWTPHAFGLRILLGTGSVSTALQQKTLTIF